MREPAASSQHALATPWFRFCLKDHRTPVTETVSESVRGTTPHLLSFTSTFCERTHIENDDENLESTNSSEETSPLGGVAQY